MEKESNCGTEEYLVCSDFVRSSVLTRRTNTTAVSECVLMNISDNNLNKPSVERFMGQNYDEWIKHLIQEPKSLSDKLRYRDCLTKALTVLCKIITENTVIDCYELDLLISENCIAGDDKMFVDANGIGTMQRTRRLLSLILLRDYKTLLTFLSSLLIQNKHVVEMVLREFNNCMQNSYRKPQKCTHCHLESRLDMTLIVDELLSYGEDWLPFYNKVCQAAYLGPSKELWQEFIGRVSACETYGHISQIVLKALQACGFHSDIVIMLQEDRQMNRNSFICRCSEILRFGNVRSVDKSPFALPAPQNKTLPRLSHNNETGTDKLRLTYSTDHKSKIFSQKTGYRDENMNKNNAETRVSEKKLFYETKGRHLNVLLERKQDPSRKSIQVRTKIRGDDVVHKNAKVGSSNSDSCKHQTDLLKLHTNVPEHKMDTLKGVESSEETVCKEVLGRSNCDPPVSIIPMIQMDMLKDGILQPDVKEIWDEHEWSMTALKSFVCGGVSGCEKIPPVDYPDKRSNCESCQHHIELLKERLPDEENDIHVESFEHQIALLKIGIEEYDKGISPSRSLQSYEETFNSVKRSFGNESAMNKEMVKETQNLFPSNHANSPETERRILNVLVVFTFLFCFVNYIVRNFYNFF